MADERIRAGKRKKKKSKALKIFTILLLLVVLSGIALVYSSLDRIKQHDLDKSKITINEIQNEKIGGYRNIAIFGVDSRENDLKENTRSDSIIIASINNETKEVKLISVYRDTYLDIDGNEYAKVNSAYNQGGPELAISTLNKNLDMNITEFVTVNFSAVTSVVDKLGGIEIDIQEDEIKEVNRYINDVAKINNTSNEKLTKAGLQTINGTQATAYSRVRYTKGSDYRRTERQRTVIYAMMKKAKDSGITTLLSVANDMLPQIYTSLSKVDILALAKDVASYDIADDSGFPFDKVGKKVKKASVVLPVNLEANVTQLHKFLFNTDNYVPSATVKSISNELKQYE